MFAHGSSPGTRSFEVLLTIDPRNPLLPAYVSKAIRAIEEVLGNDEEA
jgi:hypothetical protein